LHYDQEGFWRHYWQTFSVDPERFENLGMYPIGPALSVVRKEHKILEAGCGGGRVLRHLASEGFDVMGIEFDPGIVAALAQADPRLRVARGDIRRLEFPDAFFDVVLCFGAMGVLEHDLDRGLSELRRVLRRPGTLVCSVMLDNIARTAQRLVSVVMSRGLPVSFYAWMDTEPGWRDFFRSRGFEVMGVEPVMLRYNLYYWLPILRGGPVDPRRARIDDEAYRFNVLGDALWFLHKRWLRRSLAAGSTFCLRVR
jgi:SAM-dependent methyltransferase